MPAPTVAEPLPNGTSPNGAGGATISADLTQEYASAGGQAFVSPGFLRKLPFRIDDVTADFGEDLYERLLFDPRAAAEFDNLRAAILEDGLVLSPAIEDKDTDGYALSKKILEVAERMLDDLELPLDDVLWDLASAMPRGNRIAEEIYDYGDVGGRTGLVLTALHVKPRESVAFVVDAFNRVVGLLAREPGQSTPGPLIAFDTSNPPENLLPRSKFCIYTHKPVDNDPRGTSLLRPAYMPWVQKIETIREYIKYLARFASPALVGTLPPGARDRVEDDGAGGQRVVKATDTFKDTLLDFHNGSVLAIAYGAQVKDLYSQGDGTVFLNAIAENNRDIALVISGQTLASTEGEHNARAAAQVHQDTRATRVKQAKKALARVIRRDVLMDFVAWNWGDAAARLLTPQTALGSVEEEDKTGQWNAVAALNRASYLAPSQKQALDALIGLPRRTPEEVAREEERASQPPPAPAAPGQPGNQPPQGEQSQEGR